VFKWLGQHAMGSVEVKSLHIPVATVPPRHPPYYTSMSALAATHQCTSIPRLLAVVLVVLNFTGLASAHMAMADPPALRYKTNPYKLTEDYDYLSPLSASGSNYPCKGYHTDLGTPGGKSVATYKPGGTYKIR